MKDQPLKQAVGRPTQQRFIDVPVNNDGSGPVTVSPNGAADAVVPAHEIDALLGRLRERLRQEFDKAKRETAGKKRIRFLLK